ncbi:MAG: 16S rRNA methyltransferase [Verrucomicrobiaceae bacterium]|nr:MAG: 16S rRNA methyltransferase [Verrucomicrobiaceae bacterium]
MNPALETLMLAFAADGLPVPERALFLGAEPHPDLAGWPQVTGWQPFKPKADAWDQAGLPRTGTPQGTWPLVMVLPGKSRDETLHWFALGHDLLEPRGTLLVAMPNTAGAARFEKELSQATGEILSIQKHKCRAFRAVKSPSWNQGLMEEWRSLGARRSIPDTSFTTEAGIFSADHIDPGSRLLAAHLPASLRGKAADLGAGWGYLTDALLKRCPKITSVDLHEADARALACAERNLAEHQRGIGAKDDPLSLESPACMVADETPIRFHWHDVTKGLPERYDIILMNPPFHTGQATDVDLGRAFIRVAACALNRGGKLLLVANRQLPYEAELTVLGLSWRKVAEDPVYKLLFAEARG